MNPLKYFLIFFITIYQTYIVGDDPPFECNFRPSCSEYTKRAIHKYGVLKGVRLGWNRLRRCNDPHQLEKTSDPVP